MLAHAEPIEIDAIFAETQKRIDDDAELDLAIYKPNILSNMGGELFVREVELGQDEIKLAAPLDDKTPFFQLPFTDAIEHFTSRQFVTYEQFQSMQDKEIFRANALKKVTSTNLLRQIKDELDKSMQGKGLGLRGFVAKFSENVDKKTAAYFENVFRTSTSQSYAVGRYRSQSSDAVASVLSFWQYRTAGDSRVRDAHRRIDRLVWPAKHPKAMLVYPPNGYQCRCVMRAIRPERAAKFRSGLGVSLDNVVTPGFEGVALAA